MKVRDRKPPRTTTPGRLYDVVVRLPGSDHAPDDDCELCRRMAGSEPIETVTMPDGTVYEVHEMPTRGPRGAA